MQSVPAPSHAPEGTSEAEHEQRPAPAYSEAG